MVALSYNFVELTGAIYSILSSFGLTRRSSRIFLLPTPSERCRARFPRSACLVFECEIVLRVRRVLVQL